MRTITILTLGLALSGGVALHAAAPVGCPSGVTQASFATCNLQYAACYSQGVPQGYVIAPPGIDFSNGLLNGKLENICNGSDSNFSSEGYLLVDTAGMPLSHPQSGWGVNPTSNWGACQVYYNNCSRQQGTCLVASIQCQPRVSQPNVIAEAFLKLPAGLSAVMTAATGSP